MKKKKITKKEEQEVFDHLLSLINIENDEKNDKRFIVNITDSFQMLVSAYDAITKDVERKYIPGYEDEDFDLTNMLVTYKLSEILFSFLKIRGFEKENAKYDFYNFQDKYSTNSNIVNTESQTFEVYLKDKLALRCYLNLLEDKKELKYELIIE